MNPEMAERMDHLVNMDLTGRSIESLYKTARDITGGPLCLAAAEELARVPRRSVVLMTTGMASRSWISTRVVENDGPAGTAVLARALSLGLDAIPVILAEAEVLPVLQGIFTAAGMCRVSMDEARRTALPGGRLSVFVLQPYPVDDAEARRQATAVLDELRPAALFSAERAGFAASGIYHNARGVDFSTGKARVDYVFREANARGIPTIGVGDGGNEIGMGMIAEAVRLHAVHGDKCQCGCGSGVGADTPTKVLMTATVSNWGCYAIVACLAALLGNMDLLHTPEMEAFLQRRGVELGLINSPAGRVDPNVDNIPLAAHQAVVTLLGELARRA